MLTEETTELFFNVRTSECSNRDTNLPKQGEIIIMNDKLLVIITVNSLL